MHRCTHSVLLASGPMDQAIFQSAIELANQHKWWALAATVIGLTVRLLKNDGPIPITIPAKYRPWLAIGLGIVAGCIEKISMGTPWKTALVGGLVAGFAAISGHQLLVESARGGREIGESKPAFIKRSLPPPPLPVEGPAAPVEPPG